MSCAFYNKYKRNCFVNRTVGLSEPTCGLDKSIESREEVCFVMHSMACIVPNLKLTQLIFSQDNCSQLGVRSAVVGTRRNSGGDTSLK